MWSSRWEHAERWHQGPEKAQAVLPACNSFGRTQDPVFRGKLPSTANFCCLAHANRTLAHLSTGSLGRLLSFALVLSWSPTVHFKPGGPLDFLPPEEMLPALRNMQKQRH